MEANSASSEKRTISEAELSFSENDERAPKRVRHYTSGFDNLRTFRVQANNLAILSGSEDESSTEGDTDSDNEEEPFVPRDHYLLMPGEKAELARKAAKKVEEKAIKRKQRKAAREARLRQTGPSQSPFEGLSAELMFEVMTNVGPEDLQNLGGVGLESVHGVWSNWSHALLVRTLKTQYPGSMELFGIMPGCAGNNDELVRTEEQRRNLVNAIWVLYIAHWPDRSNRDAEAAAKLQQTVDAIEEGQLDYWNFLRNLSDHMDRDLDALDQMIGEGITDLGSIRAATLLLWRLKWPEVTGLTTDSGAGQGGLRIETLSTIDQARTVLEQPAQVQDTFRAICRMMILYLDNLLDFATDGLDLILECSCIFFSGGDTERPAKLSALLLWLEKENTGFLTAHVIVSGLQNLVDVSEAVSNGPVTRRMATIKNEYQILLSQKLEYVRHGVQATDVPLLADLGRSFCRDVNFEIGFQGRPADNCWGSAQKLVRHQDRISQKFSKPIQTDSEVPNPPISSDDLAQYIGEIEEDD